MGSTAKILAAVVGCVVLAGCIGIPGGGPKTVSEDVLQKVGLTYHWSLSLELRAGETIDEIHVVDDTLYCLSNMGRLFSVAAENGHRKWTYDVCAPGQRIYRPIHAPKMLVGGKISGIKSLLKRDLLSGIDPVNTTIVNTQFNVLVLDRNSGKELRNVKFSFAANTAGAADDRRFYVGSVEGLVHCFGLQEAIQLSSFYTADVLSAPVVYYKEHVYAGSEDNTFYAASAGDHIKKEWTRPVSGPITAEFHVDARACFVPCEDNRLYAFRTSDGSDFWDQPFICQGPLRRGVQVTDRTVLQQAAGDKFYAIDLVKGAQRWALPEGLEVLGTSGSLLYVRDVNNNLLVVDEILGDVKSSLPMTGFDLFARNVQSSKIWTATRRGTLFCIRPL